MLKKTLLVLLMMISVDGRADTPGPFGIGLVLGDPTGLSANYMKGSERSIDAALAWNFGSETGLEFHADYLWHRHGIFNIETAPFSMLYGIGGRMLFVNSRNNEAARTKIGPRLPVGLETNFGQKALEAFAEIALVMNVIPATSADFDFGIGLRVYF